MFSILLPSMLFSQAAHDFKLAGMSDMNQLIDWHHLCEGLVTNITQLSASPCVYLSISLVHIPFPLSVCLSICLFVCLSRYICLLDCLPV